MSLKESLEQDSLIYKKNLDYREENIINVRLLWKLSKIIDHRKKLLFYQSIDFEKRKVIQSLDKHQFMRCLLKIRRFFVENKTRKNQMKDEVFSNN